MTEPTDVPEKPSPKPRKRRVVWHSFRVLGLLLGLPVLFLVIGILMMVDRDISAPSWIKERVAERAEAALAGGSLEFGTITVNVGRDLHPRLRLTDTELRDADGAIIAEISEVGGLLSPRGLLFERSALVQEITVSGVDLTLAREADGSVALSFDQTERSIQAAPDLGVLMRQFDQVFEQPAMVALEQVNIIELALTYSDKRGGKVWRVEDGEATLDLRDGKTVATANLALKQENAADTQLVTVFERDRETQTARLEITIADANAGDIAAQSPAISWLAAINAPLSGTVETSLDADGALGPIVATLDIAAGALHPNDATAPLNFQTAKTRLTYFPDADQIQFEDFQIVSDWGAVHADGQAVLQSGPDGLPETIIAQLSLSDIVINPPGYYPTPRAVDGAYVDFRLALDPFTVDIGQFVLVDENVPLAVSGNVAATDAGWIAALDLEVDQIDQAVVKSWWPIGVKPKTYKWFDENLSAGIMSDVVSGFRVQPGASLRYSIGFEFDAATVQFLSSMPPITDGVGYGSFIDNAFHLTLDQGQVAAPQGGNLDFAGSTMHIRDLRVPGGLMDLNFNVDSSITGALSMLNLPPFTFLDKANLPVTLADGRVETRGVVTVPVKNKPTRSEVSFAFDADLRRVSSDVLVKGRTLTASNLSLSVDREVLEVSGPASVSGVPFSGTYRQTFGADGARTVTTDVELSQRFLDAFGIALPPGSVNGRGIGQLSVAFATGAAPTFELSSDLRGVGVALPPIGWAKSPDRAGALRVTGALGEPTRIDRLQISGGGLAATGTVALNSNGTLNAARFSQVQLDDWLRATITIRGRGRGRPVGVEIAGGALDLRRARFGARGGESGPLSIALDRLQITDGIAFSDFRGEFDGAGGFSGQFSGNLNGLAGLRGTVVPQNGRSAVRLISDNAGAVVAAAGFLKNATGGSLDLTLLPAGGEGTFDGNLLIRDLRVRDAPAMAALLNAISVVGLLQQLDGQGLAFDEVDARFRLSPRQVVVTQSSAVGPGLGISLDGIYTLASKNVDFQGVISPIYLLNGIGSFLTRKGEGLIGFNFSISGSSDRPAVSVNPLSALTPGMFREIFRRPPPQVGQ